MTGRLLVGPTALATAAALLSMGDPVAAQPASVAGNVAAGGGYDGNPWLDVALDPSVATVSGGGQAFGRVAPDGGLGIALGALRLDLRYAADLRRLAGAGWLADQDLSLAARLLERGRVAGRLAVSAGRFDAPSFPGAQYREAGGEGALTIRLTDAVRLSPGYRLDVRGYSDPSAGVVGAAYLHAASLGLGARPRPSTAFGGAVSWVGIRAAGVLERLDRLRAGADASAVLSARLSVSGEVFAAWQAVFAAAGDHDDRQAGARLTLAARIGGHAEAIAGWEGALSRSASGAGEWSRQVATLSLRVFGGATFGERSPGHEAWSDQPPRRAGARVLFRLRAPGAHRVVVVGTWDGWGPGTDLTPGPEPDTWQGWVEVGPGALRFHFLVDGVARRPPAAERHVADGFGGEDGFVEGAAR